MSNIGTKTSADSRYHRRGFDIDEVPIDKSKFLKTLFDQYIIEDNTVVIALINGYIKGFDYGGCLNDDELIRYRVVNKHKQYISKEEIGDRHYKKFEKRNSIYFLSIDAWQRISDKSNFNILNYVLSAIYRDVLRYMCQKRIAFSKGDKRCIFTTSTFDRIEDCIYSVQFPTISRKARCELRKYIPHKTINTAKKELLLLKPNSFITRNVIRFKSNTLFTILAPLFAAIFTSFVAGLLVEVVAHCIWT